MQKILIALLAMTLLAPSCKRYLDIKPKGIQIPEFYDDYVRLLNHKNMMNADNPYTVYITDDILLGDPTVPYGQFEQALDFQQNLYSFSNGAIFSKGTNDPLWTNAYKRVYTFNVVINNAGTCTDGTEQEKKALVAEAKLGRAFEFLMLVNTYAKEYNAATASSDPGIPAVLSEDINKPYSRQSVQQVYDQIRKDLEEALPDLLPATLHPFRPSKQVGNAFLAKMYLCMNDHEKARSFAEKALETKSTLTDLTLYSINPAANGMGRIWDAATAKAYPEAKDNVESIYARYGEAFIGLSRNIYASTDLLNTYATDLPSGAIDQRRTLYFADNQFKLYTQTYNFPGKSMWVPYIMFNVGFNTAELYLIAAEGYARKDQPEKALQLLDQLRNKRIKNNQPLPLMNAALALKTVLDERRREFAFCGSYRLMDLKRLNRESSFQKNIVHTDGISTWILPANDPRYILPLPPRVIEINPGIPQYER